MRYAHIADVHLGKKVDEGAKWEKQASKEHFDGFVNLIDSLELENIDFLFITGDLFDHVPTTDELKQVDMQFARLYRTNIIYVTGEADYLAKGAHIWKYKFRSNMYLLNGEEFNNCVPEEKRPVRNSYADGIADSIYFEDYNLDIYGICQYSNANTRNDLDYVYAHNLKRVNVLLGHGGDDKVAPFSLDDLKTKNFDYIGMGHFHNFKCKKDLNLYYPGAPEPFEASATGEHGYIKGYIDKGTHSNRFVVTANRRYSTISIDADENLTNSGLIKYLDDLCKKDKRCVYSIEINRNSNCYIDYNIDEIKEKYRILSVCGDIAEEVDFKKLEHINIENVLGKTLYRIRNSKSPNANAAFNEYALAVSKEIWGDGNVVEESNFKLAGKSQAVRANQVVIDDKMKDISSCKEQMEELAVEHTKLKKQLVQFPDRTGDLNSIRTDIKDIEYEIDRVKFQDDCVDEIYNRKRLAFVLLINVPIALVITYLLIVGPIHAFFFMNWNQWFNRLIFGLAIFVITTVLGVVLYNKSIRIRQRIFGTKIPYEEHTKNKLMLRELEDKLSTRFTEEARLKGDQTKHLNVKKEIKNLEQRMKVVDDRYKKASLIVGDKKQ